MSYMRRVLSPIKRPSRNPVWALETNLSRTEFSLFAIAAEALLYIADNKETGRQFRWFVTFW